LINAAALALGSLGGTSSSPLGVCTADRPVGCDVRRRSCVGHAFDQRCCSRSRKLGRHRPLAARSLRCSVSAPLITLSGVTLAAAAASATLSINAAALALGSLSGTTARCSASAPLIALPGVTLAFEAASATLSINAAALALGSLSDTGRSLLGVCTAGRPVECDAGRRSCVGNTLDQRCCSCFRKLGRHGPLADRRLHR
jgi:hypothetical protein